MLCDVLEAVGGRRDESTGLEQFVSFLLDLLPEELFENDLALLVAPCEDLAELSEVVPQLVLNVVEVGGSGHALDERNRLLAHRIKVHLHIVVHLVALYVLQHLQRILLYAFFLLFFVLEGLDDLLVDGQSKFGPQVLFLLQQQVRELVPVMALQLIQFQFVLLCQLNAVLPPALHLLKLLLP